MKTYIFHADSGHAWLAVKRAELIRLNILEKITNYSYQRGATVYLEEDCDAGIFIKAKKAYGEMVNIEEKYSDKRSNIRHYDFFSSKTSWQKEF